MKEQTENYTINMAEPIFEDDIGTTIVAKVMTDTKEGLIFKGKLINIFCNTFIIETENGIKEMFRYEDLINLKGAK